MKDLVGDVWKIAAACASGAFLLSLVVGLFTGNPFGVVILRAFLIALLFAGLGAALRFVVRAYLPELIASSSAAGADETSRADAASQGGAGAPARDRGGAVDILLQDDEGLRQQAFGGSGRVPRSRPSESAAATAAEAADAADAPEAADGTLPELEASLDQDFMTQGDTPGMPELEAELAEELPPTRKSAGTGGSAGAVKTTESSGELPGGRNESTGGIDSLPDIDVLEPVEDKAERPLSRAPARPLRPAARDTPGHAVHNALSEQDPSTLARAIRTVLKKSEEG